MSDYIYNAMERAAGKNVKPAIFDPPAVPNELTDKKVIGLRATPGLSGVKQIPSARRIQLPALSSKLFAVPSAEMSSPRIAALEQCRNLRSRVLNIVKVRKLQTLLVTSCMAGDGKSITSANLAIALSQVSNSKILLIDADLRKPTLGSLFGIRTNEGMSNALIEKREFQDYLWQVGDNLHVLPAGRPTDKASELLHGERMTELLAEAREIWPIIICDSAPLFPIADSRILSEIVDGAILVVRAGQTSFELLKEAQSALEGRLVGSLLNCAETVSENNYYTYSSTQAKAEKRWLSW